MISYEPVARISSPIFLFHVSYSIPACGPSLTPVGGVPLGLEPAGAQGREDWFKGHCICISALRVASRSSTSFVRAVSSSSRPYCSSTPVRVSSTSLCDLSSSWSYQSIRIASFELYSQDKLQKGSPHCSVSPERPLESFLPSSSHRSSSPRQ